MADRADFAPELGALKSLRPFVFWAQTTLPTVFDDSLSYYEVLTKLTKMVNTLLENEDTNAENIAALAEAYQELEDFTNNYFENLDVTQEINDKLDALVADGTIGGYVTERATTLVNNYLYGEDGESGVNKDIEDLISQANADITQALNTFNTNSTQALRDFDADTTSALRDFRDDATDALGTIPDTVEAWLEQNFTNPQSTPLDATLSVESAAAQAKATGEAIESAIAVAMGNSHWNYRIIDVDYTNSVLANHDGSNASVTSEAVGYDHSLHIASVTPGESYLISCVGRITSPQKFAPAYALASLTYDMQDNPVYVIRDIYPRSWDDTTVQYEIVRNKQIIIPSYQTGEPVNTLLLMGFGEVAVTPSCSQLVDDMDTTLTSQALPAQGKAVGDALDAKLPWPVSNGSKDLGTAGYGLFTNADGTTSWRQVGDVAENKFNTLALSDRDGILSGVVNYDYDEYVKILAEPTSTSGIRRVGIERAFGQIALNIPTAPTSLVRIKISGDVEKASNNAGTEAWVTGISLNPGHVYKIDTRMIGGSVTVPGETNPPYISAYKVGTHAGIGTVEKNGNDSTYTFVAPSDPVNLLVNIQANTTASNAVYQVILRDKSEIVGDDTGIPQTFPSVQPSSSGEIVIPAIIHSEKLVNYNCNIDGTKRATTQALCSDGIRYLFFPARANAGYDADDEVPIMVKWDTVTNAPVVVNANAPKSYGHIDDMCFVPASVPGIDNGNVDRLYLTDMNRSTAAGYTGAVHVVDANTLEFITTVQTYDQNDNSKNLVSTALAPYWHGVYHVGYSPDREMFFAHSGGLSAADPDNRLNQTLAILDKNGSVIKGLKFVRSEGTIFGCDCDANYIYIAIYSSGETEGTFDIRLAVFDWNLNPITSAIVDQKTWEIEGTCHIGNTFYFSWILPAGNARTGCYITKQTYKKNSFFDRNTTFPVNWVENQFHVSSFQPFTA